MLGSRAMLAVDGAGAAAAAAAEAAAASSFEQKCRKSGRSLANLTAVRDVGLFNIASLKLVPDMAGEHWDLNDQRRCMISFDTPPSRSEEQRPESAAGERAPESEGGVVARARRAKRAAARARAPGR